VASWDELAGRPGLASAFHHVVALDPPPLPGLAESLPGPHGAFAHLAWGPDDVRFALAAWTAGLQLDQALRATWRVLRDLAGSGAEELQGALCGPGRHPRPPAVCGRLLRVLVELSLVHYAPVADGGPRCSLVDGARTELESSPAYRSYRARHGAIERALEPELGRAAPQPQPARQAEPPRPAIAA
jgi:hypothetical protein